LYYANSGNVQQGIDTYHNCLKLCKDYGLENSQNAHKIQDNLARALGKLNRIDEAIQLVRGSIETAVQNGDTIRENVQRINIADYLIEIDAFTEAEQHLNLAIQYFSENKEYHYLIFAYRCKARLYEVQKK